MSIPLTFIKMKATAVTKGGCLVDTEVNRFYDRIHTNLVIAFGNVVKNAMAYGGQPHTMIGYFNLPLLEAGKAVRNGLAMFRNTAIPNGVNREVYVVDMNVDRMLFDSEKYGHLMTIDQRIILCNITRLMELLETITYWAKARGVQQVSRIATYFSIAFLELKSAYERVVSLETLVEVREQSINSLAQKYRVKLVSGETDPIDEMPIERAASLASNPMRRVIEFMCL